MSVETATRALLLTDLVDSTALVESLGDARAAEVLAAHDRVARDLLASHDGVEIDKTDGFLLLFRDPARALAYAGAYHHALAAVSARLDVRLLARAGLHVGEVVLRTNAPEDIARGAKPLEVEGLAKPFAARVMSVATAGQTLLSSAARDTLTGRDLAFVSHGHWRMKGVSEPVELVEARTPGAPMQPPPDGAKVYRVVHVGDAWVPVRERPSNVPAERDRLVGRARLLGDVAAALDAGATLITLAGPPGAGTSRLAASYARRWAGSWPGGAFWVAASVLRSRADLDEAVSRALGPGASLRSREPTLLVLDGLPRSSGALALRLLEEAPHVAILVPRHAPLGVPAERVLTVPPLSEEDAVTLFLDRAATADAPTPRREHVTAVVRTLGHLPGPIERAAIRLSDPGATRPYRGLSSFGPGDEELFCGRDAEARDLARLIEEHPLITVTGVSGAGKTSLLQAGVRAALPGWAVVVVRPGADPVVALSSALERAPGLAPLAESIAAAPATRHPARPPSPTLVVVDQAEELLTLTPDPAARARAGAAIVALSETEDVRVAIVVREDHFARLADIEPLRSVYHRCVAVVTRPSPEGLAETLTRPAALFGVRYEDGLVPQMVAAVEDETAALPLLQFCADRLWERRDPAEHVLTYAAYEAVGGVAGALATHAGSVLAGMSGAEQGEARRQLLRLVTSDQTREPRRRAELLESAEDRDRAEAVIARLVEARLLSVFEADDGAPMVELAHEALLRHWGRLRDWLAEDEEGQRLLRALRSSAAEWARSGRLPGLLWRGAALQRLRAWRQTSDAGLTAEETAFAAASEALATRARRRSRAAITGALLGATLVTAGALGLWRRAEGARAEAVAAQAVADDNAAAAKVAQIVAVARREVSLGQDLTGVRLGREALERAPTSAPARSALLEGLGRLAAQQELATDAVDYGAPWSPDGDRVVTSRGGAAELLDGGGRLLARVRAESAVRTPLAIWRPDGSEFVTTAGDETLVWDRDGALRGSHPFGAALRVVSPDSATILVLSGGGGSGATRVALVDREGAVTRPLESANVKVAYAGWDHTGQTFYTVSGRGALTWWGRDGSPRGRLDPPGGCGVASVAPRPGPDGGYATVPVPGCPGNAIRLVGSDGRAGAALPLAEGRRVMGAAWSEDGALVAGATAGGDAAIWDAAGALVARLPADCRPSIVPVWSGGLVAMGCEDSSVVILDRGGTLVRRWATGRGPVQAVQWADGGATLLTKGGAGSLLRWPTEGGRAGDLALPGGPTVDCAWDDEGALLAVVREDGTTGTVPAGGGAWRPTAIRSPRLLAWSPTGSHLAAATEAGLTVVDRRGDAVLALAADAGPAPGDAAEGPPPAAGPTIDTGPIAAVRWNAQGTHLGVVGARGAARVDLAGSITTLEDPALGDVSTAGSVGAWDPAGERFVAGVRAGRGWLWGPDGKLLERLRSARIGAVVWHPSGRRFLVSTPAWEARTDIYDRDGRLLRTVEGSALAGWSPDGRTIALVRERSAWIESDEDGREVARLPTTSQVAWLQWDLRGTRLVATAQSGDALVWEADGTRYAAFPLAIPSEPWPACCVTGALDALTCTGARVRHWPLRDDALLRAVDRAAPQRFSDLDDERYLR